MGTKAIDDSNVVLRKKKCKSQSAFTFFLEVNIFITLFLMDGFADVDS